MQAATARATVVVRRKIDDDDDDDDVQIDTCSKEETQAATDNS